MAINKGFYLDFNRALLSLAFKKINEPYTFKKC